MDRQISETHLRQLEIQVFSEASFDFALHLFYKVVVKNIKV